MGLVNGAEWKGDGVQSVDRTCGILAQFTERPGESLGISELTRITGYTKSVVHRTISALVANNFLTRDDESARYRLGPMLIELGVRSLASFNIAEVARPVMQRLMEQTGETATLSLLTGNSRIYAAQVESNSEVRMTVQLGTKLPLYAGASGRVILAALDDVQRNEYLSDVEAEKLTDHTVTDVSQLLELVTEDRVRGYSVSHGERTLAGLSVAAALYNASASRVVGAVAVSGPASRFSEEAILEDGRLVRLAAEEIGRSCW